MFILARYTPVTAHSAEGVVGYVGGHLQASPEVGGLASAPGYLSKDGQVLPIALNPELWRQVGWNPDSTPLPPAALLKALTQGQDMGGNPLTRRGQAKGSEPPFRAPRELVVTIPSEVSEALLNQGSEASLRVMRQILGEALHQIESQAVRVRKGSGTRIWAPAKTLSLAYVHAENRLGETHLHLHIYTFGPALDQTGTWRTRDNQAHLLALQGKAPFAPVKKVTSPVPEIRNQPPAPGRLGLSKTLQEACWKEGLRVDMDLRFAWQAAPKTAHGATVNLPNGTQIKAGSLHRQRRAEILAAQELRAVMGAPKLTTREIEKLRKYTGKLPKDIPDIKRRDLFWEKANALGLLDPEGTVLPGDQLHQRLQEAEMRMAEAQVRLEASAALASPYPAAAHLLADARKQLAEEVPGVSPEASTQKARLRWTQDYETTLRRVVEAGTEGLTTQGLDKPTRNLLSKLKAAGLLQMEKTHGRAIYNLTPAGLARVEGLRIQRSDLGHPQPPGLYPNVGSAPDSPDSPSEIRSHSSHEIAAHNSPPYREARDRGGVHGVHSETKRPYPGSHRGTGLPAATWGSVPSPRIDPFPRMDTLRSEWGSRHGSFPILQGGRTRSVESSRSTQGGFVNGSITRPRFAGLLPAERTGLELRPWELGQRPVLPDSRLLLHAASTPAQGPRWDLPRGPRPIPGLAFGEGWPGRPGGLLGAGRGLPGPIPGGLLGLPRRWPFVTADPDASLLLSLNLWSRNAHAVVSATRWVQEVERQKEEQNLQAQREKKIQAAAVEAALQARAIQKVPAPPNPKASSLKADLGKGIRH